MPTTERFEALRRHWDRSAAKYDPAMIRAERWFFDGTRSWIASRASGRVLEVAVGTGLNLERYPEGVELTGIDLSPQMLDRAKARARSLGIDADLRVGNAQDLDFPDASFDTVVCTFSLCAVPDDAGAVDEMVRVLRPGGLLLLADHVVSTSWWLRGMQRALEVVSIRSAEEHFRRRPFLHVEAAGLVVEAHDRFKKGVFERLAARKPDANAEV
jgi:ubiquinone/menaquinone biosynthesis C-methylase UbiE